VEQGAVGLGLYLWMVVGLFRLGGRHRHSGGEAVDTMFFSSLRRLWPLLLGVYLVNGCFVVMNYQFVNALLFTIAGILAAEKRRAQEI
ncbi:MAG TPA: hypothetical protein VGF08_13065, partial [Terriglobales bacterium]